MYKKFYGLKDKPFNPTPDSPFLYLGSHHREAIDFLTRKIKKSNAHLIALTGEIGSGKTILLRSIIKDLPIAFEAIQVMYPSNSFNHLLQMVLLNMGVKSIHSDLRSLRMTLKERLIQIRHLRKQPLLLIDEAQKLSRDALSEVMTLSEMKDGRKHLLKVVLSGLPGLRKKLLSLEPRHEDAIHHLEKLGHKEVPDYIQHRFAVAGCTDCHIFTNNVMDEIIRMSGRIPRTINAICDAALTQGYIAHNKNIDLPFFREVVEKYIYSLDFDSSLQHKQAYSIFATSDPDDAFKFRSFVKEKFKKPVNEPDRKNKKKSGTNAKHSGYLRLPLHVIVLEKNARMKVHLENEFHKWNYNIDITSGFEELFELLEKAKDTEMQVLIADGDFFFCGKEEDPVGKSALDRIQSVYAYIPIIMNSTLPLSAIRSVLFQRGIPYLLKKPLLNRIDVSEITTRFNLYFEDLQNSLAHIHAQFGAFYQRALKQEIIKMN